MHKVFKKSQHIINELMHLFLNKIYLKNPSMLIDAPRQIVVISRTRGNKIGMGLSNQTSFCD